jgi:hypothetical protein
LKEKQLLKRQEPLATFVIGEKETAVKKQGRKKYQSPSISDVPTSRETEDKDKIQSAMTTLPTTVTGLQIGTSATLKNIRDTDTSTKNHVIARIDQVTYNHIVN